MTAPSGPGSARVAGFRLRLMVAMMLIVAVITATALALAERNLAANVERDLGAQFQAELDALHHAQQIRRAALVERSRALVRRPRIHAALEDNALDLLYPSAEDELRDVMESGDQPLPALHARFYRFLDRQGAVIPPAGAGNVGRLSPDEERQLAMRGAPDQPQLGYLPGGDGDAAAELSEVITMPVISTENGEVIATLVLGFKPVELGGAPPGAGIRSGIWQGGRLYLAALEDPAQSALAAEVARAIAAPDRTEDRFHLTVNGVPHLLFYQRLNPGSLFPPAYEVSLRPLTELLVRQRQLRWQVVGLGGLLLLGGLGASHVLSGRLSRPVEALALDSEEDRARRARAEAALELTSAELQRSARFSADASHQLKTPVTVLRAGLEELLAKDNLTPAECDQLSALIHQTYRLSSVIEDLLLLSRLDAGRLKLDFRPVNLTALIEASLDDLGALPDELNLRVETDFPPGLHIGGEKRYTSLILQNLLENARKYNRPGGLIHLAARTEGDRVLLTVGNTGRPIPAEAQAHIFERFHRGAMGENVPGYGLGLNLARELARLHHGDLRLVRSDAALTEFEASFVLAPAPAGAA
ncbi:MAG TPA: HAMP domain-containing sensor histidine kinase [Opitutaceae bacterium]|nr:HAMP domain-containing sensor histidine kinase [Opitutaceae bacterium]